MKRGRKPLPAGKRKDVMLRFTVTQDVDEWLTEFAGHNNIDKTTLLRECLGEFMVEFNTYGRQLVLNDPTFDNVRKMIMKKKGLDNADMS